MDDRKHATTLYGHNIMRATMGSGPQKFDPPPKEDSKMQEWVDTIPVPTKYESHGPCWKIFFLRLDEVLRRKGENS